MKAAILTGFGDVDLIQIKVIPVPALGKAEVLVEVKAAGLNPKDVLIRKGNFKRLSGKKFPQQIGFDFSGVVIEPNNSKLRKGERVFGMLNGWQGRCCAEMLAVKAGELYKMPERLSFEEAAGMPLVGQTALQAIRDLGQLEPNQRICINGASGGVGTVAIQIAKALGGHVTTLSSERNKAFCQSLGADIALDYAVTNISKVSEKFDLFFDVFGNYSYKKCAPILNERGIYVTTVPKPEIFLEQAKNLFRKKKAKMVVVKSNSADLQYLHNHIQTDQLHPVIDKVFSLAEIGIAQKYIESKRAKGKVILTIG